MVIEDFCFVIKDANNLLPDSREEFEFWVQTLFQQQSSLCYARFNYYTSDAVISFWWWNKVV
jgi:hypothetical protein